MDRRPKAELATVSGIHLVNCSLSSLSAHFSALNYVRSSKMSGHMKLKKHSYFYLQVTGSCEHGNKQPVFRKDGY
jgi:hypothetical protein